MKGSAFSDPRPKNIDSPSARAISNSRSKPWMQAPIIAQERRSCLMELESILVSESGDMVKQ